MARGSGCLSAMLNFLTTLTRSRVGGSAAHGFACSRALHPTPAALGAHRYTCSRHGPPSALCLQHSEPTDTPILQRSHSLYLRRSEPTASPVPGHTGPTDPRSVRGVRNPWTHLFWSAPISVRSPQTGALSMALGAHWSERCRSSAGPWAPCAVE